MDRRGRCRCYRLPCRPSSVPATTPRRAFLARPHAAASVAPRRFLAPDNRLSGVVLAPNAGITQLARSSRNGCPVPYSCALSRLHLRNGLVSAAVEGIVRTRQSGHTVTDRRQSHRIGNPE
jgi:hypothetical protein